MSSALRWSGWSKFASLVTSVAAIAALWFTSQSLRATNNQYEISRQTAVTDRYAKAVEALDSPDKIDVRLGGIYLLDRLARDSAPDASTIYSVLSAYIRTQRPVAACNSGPSLPVAPPVDIQAALTVIGKRAVSNPGYVGRINFDDACLGPVVLGELDLSYTDFDHTNLVGANISGKTARNASFLDANLSGAMLQGADFEEAIFGLANLSDAQFINTNLTESNFADTNLTNVQFIGTDLTHANFEGANLSGTDLSQATLTDVTWDSENDTDRIYYDRTTNGRQGLLHRGAGPSRERTSDMGSSDTSRWRQVSGKRPSPATRRLWQRSITRPATVS